MRVLKFSFLFFFAFFYCYAAIGFSRGVNKISSSTGKLKILAVMVEFQKDNDAVTVGDGTFGSLFSKDWGTKIIDPLPHDVPGYYEKHLLFAKNYFEKLSNGNLKIEYSVLPRKVTLSKKMKDYSPAVGSTNFKPIGDMMEEVWKAVDSDTANKDLNFSDYQLFTVFHAGVGRDVSLPGSLGNERDIPSLYLGLKSLRSIYGASYSGIPVRNASFNITNSMILPQSESRETESYGAKYLTQMSFNGLIVANIASHLELPDLFDTKTGISAIGRFGLMDGQSIFSYGSAFLGEPSAWEKIELGWVKPVELSPDRFQDFLKLNVVNSRTAGISDTTIYKVRINSNEYFLIENRQRDAKNDGAKIVIFTDGRFDTLRFAKDTAGFFSYDTKSLYGIVTDVDEFDWALPGSGILIWHIDEKVIRENRDSNRINIDKNRRGVCLVEADGIKDIGNQFTSVLGDIVTGEGSDEDFWFSANPAKLYSNKFNPTTRPNTSANDGGNSHIWMKDFSANANTMSFYLKIGSDVIKNVFTKKIASFNAPSLVLLDTLVTSFGKRLCYILQTGDSVYAIDENGNDVFSAPDFSDFPVAVADDLILGIKDSTIASVFNPGLKVVVPEGKISSPLYVKKTNNGWEGLVGVSSGNVYQVKISAATGLSASLLQQGKSISPVEKIVSMPDGYAYICQDQSAGGNFRIVDSYGLNYSAQGKVIDFWTAQNISGAPTYIVLLKGNTFCVFEKNNLTGTFTLPSLKPIEKFSLVDLKRDSNPYIVFESAGQLYAYTIAGVTAENFPVRTGEYSSTGNHRPLAALDETRKEMFVYSLSSIGLHAISGSSGSDKSGFPFSFVSNSSTLSIANKNGKMHVMSFDTAAALSVWQVDDKSHSMYVMSLNGSSDNSQMLAMSSQSIASSAFLPKDKTYNYPNPVYGGSTFIRYYVNEDSKINIRIYDISGDLTAEINSAARGGVENESMWDVTKIQSGVYLARVEATGNSGKKESTIIKIAVIK